MDKDIIKNLTETAKITNGVVSVVVEQEDGTVIETTVYPRGSYPVNDLEKSDEATSIISFSSAGEYLKHARKSNDMLLQDLGAELGVSHQYLSQLENGKRKITYKICEEVMKILELDKNYFKYLCGYLTKEEYVGLEFLKLQNDGSESLFWEALRMKRKALGLTGNDLAEFLGVTQSYFSKIERGHQIPSRQTFEKMIELLEMVPVIDRGDI